MISRQKTTVAVFRQMLGLSAEEFGKIIGKSVSTVVKLESGQLKLSEETAFTISQETGVDMHWLMVAKPKEKPYVVDEGDGRKRPYERELFEKIQAQRKRGTFYLPNAANDLIRALFTNCDLLSVYNAAAAAGRAELVAYVVKQFADGLVERFGKDDEAFLRLNADARIITTDGAEWRFTKSEDDSGVTLQEVAPPKRKVKRALSPP